MKLLTASLMLIALSMPVFANPAATEALNQLRAAAGRAPVVYSSLLEQAALAHATDMARTGTFSHTGSNGSSVGQRVTRAGYEWCFVAENIAHGQETLRRAMTGWRNSRGHYRNMIHRRAEAFGLARTEGRYWVMVLAAPC